MSVAQFYLFGMLQRTVPADFIAPCLPIKTTTLPSGGKNRIMNHDSYTGRYIDRRR